MEDPISVTMSDSRKELLQKSLDFGLKEGGGKCREEGFQVVFDEVHHYEDSKQLLRVKVGNKDDIVNRSETHGMNG